VPGVVQRVLNGAKRVGEAALRQRGSYYTSSNCSSGKCHVRLAEMGRPRVPPARALIWRTAHPKRVFNLTGLTAVPVANDEKVDDVDYAERKAEVIKTNAQQGRRHRLAEVQVRSCRKRINNLHRAFSNPT